MLKTDSGWEITFYCPCKKCCGPNANGITACGHKLTKKDEFKVCAAPKNFPCGTKITVTGGWNGTLVVLDRAGAITGKRLDIFVWTHQTAKLYGRKKNCTISY